MKISKIAALAKKEKDISIFSAHGMQWASLRSAVYPLYSVPFIKDAEGLLTIFDVPPVEWDQWKVSFGCCEHSDELCVRELSHEEAVMRPMPFGLVLGGDSITVFDNGVMVKTKFLSPCDKITAVTAGRGFVRVFDGTYLSAAIYQYMPTPQMLDEVIPFMGYLQHLREQLQYEEQMNINMED